MDEQQALAKMISPGMKRPKIWRNGVLQIWITRACDLACFGCTQGSNLGGKPGMMSVEQFEQAVISLKGYFGVVGIFGGNPAIHPHFDQLVEILKRHVPFEQRGLWCNHPRGNGKLMRGVFNPQVSNINVHLVQEAADEFARDWPEIKPFIKGLDRDSRHSPPFVAMQDVDVLPFPNGESRPNTEANRWELIANCDINKFWSAIIGVFRKELRGYFCEIAGAQAMLHQYDEGYPDLGVPIEPDWWRRSMADFAAQVRYHCHACGIPLRGHGELAVTGTTEQVSKTHADIYKPKTRGRDVELVQLTSQLDGQSLKRATDYIENGERKK